MVLLGVVSSVASHRQLADKHAGEDGEEVADVQRHDRKHTGNGVSANPFQKEFLISLEPTLLAEKRKK